MPRRNEEPEWNSDEDEERSSGEESGFSNEGSEEGSEEESEEESSGEESGSEEDEDSQYGSEEEDGSSEGSNNGDDDSSDVSDDVSSDDESMDDVAFDDEEGRNKRGGTSGTNMMTDPSANPSWTKFVPAKIVAMGISAALLCCCCMILVPLSLIIGLSVGLTRGGDDTTLAPTKVPTLPPTPVPTFAPTPAPTPAPVIKASTLGSDATTTIYREGISAGSPFGEEETMLVQNGPPGNAELPSAYSLVQFDGIVGIDTDATSVDAYLSSIEDLTVKFCLTVASNTNEDKITYSTCLLPSTSAPEPIDALSGITAPSYTIPGDCVNNQVVTFEVDSSATEVCVDVASLLATTNATAAANSTDVNPSLRGRRRAEDATGVNVTYLFMIDSLEESDRPGARFFSSKDPQDREPTLTIEGENTCQSATTIACSVPGFSQLCELVTKAGLASALDSNDAFKTIFAPSDDAFGKLSNETLKALDDPAALIDVLQYHIAPKKIMAKDLVCSAPIEMSNLEQTITLCGANGAVYQVGSGVSPGVNGLPEIISANIETCYGVIHVIDEVLIPADTETNVTCISENDTSNLDFVCKQPGYSMICTMLDTIGIMDALSSGLYTIFAPTDEAFTKARAALGQSVDFTDTGLITSVVLQHLVSGSAIYAKDLQCNTQVEMANGDSNTITCEGDKVFIGGAGNIDSSSLPEIIEADTVGCNFVLHSIDDVILPDLGIPIDNSTGGGNVTLPPVVDPGNSVTSVLSDDATFSTLVTLATLADLVDVLSTTQDITVLAPDNDAFDALTASLPDIVANLASGDWNSHLENMLLHHVISTEISSSEITTGQIATTLNGEDVKFKINMNKKLLVDKVKIINADTKADNGIVHTLQGVLLPSWVDESIVDVLGGNSDLSGINGFITQANLVETLSGKGPFTVFAPTNSVIEKNLTSLSSIGAEDSALIALLNYHIVPGLYPASSITDGLSLPTAMGENLMFNLVGETATVNGNKISSSNVLANNGIIHLIDGVLLPLSLQAGLGGIGPFIPDAGAATTACSICGGKDTFTFKTPDAMVTLPDGVSLLNIDGTEASCTLLEQACQAGYCDVEDCAAFAASDANEKCGCEQA